MGHKPLGSPRGIPLESRSNQCLWRRGVCNTQTGTGSCKRQLHPEVLLRQFQGNFDPILHAEEIPSNAPIPTDLLTHCREISVAEGIVVIHPNWWGQPPAILKGWVDRVIRPRVAYRFEDGDSGEGIPVGLLEAKFALVFNTSNTSTQREVSVFGDPLQSIWKQCVFDLCGVTNFHREMFNIIVTSTATQRESWLLTTREIVKRFAQPSKQGVTC